MPAPIPTGADAPAAVATAANAVAAAAGIGAEDAGGAKGRPPRLGARLCALLRRRRRWWVAGALLGLAAAGLILAGPHVGAWYHFRSARAAVERYHNPQAIRHLQACLRVWPDDADVLLLAARTARRARAYDEAERGLEKYQQLRGCDGAAAFEQLLLAAERVGEDRVADVCWRHVEQGHPETPLILEALTRGYLRHYRLIEARRCLGHWLQRQPDNPQALCLRGQLHLDYEHALVPARESYGRAVQLDPDHEDARLGLAVTLLESKAFAEAATHLEYLTRCQPDNPRVQVDLARCRDGQGRRDEAIRLVDAVLAQRPHYARALALRGHLAVEGEEYAAAEAWLRPAVAAGPGDAQARYDLVRCLRYRGKEDEAQEHEARIKQREADRKRFHEIATVEMAQRPHDPQLHYTLGRLLLRSGRRAEALRWLHSALRLDPQYAPARAALAEYYREAAAQQEQPE
jgi:tetratricopeptide (TPR) repeat protein